MREYFAAHEQDLPASGLYGRVLQEIERPLLAMTLFDLWATETKGSWIGSAISWMLLAFTYFWFFNYEALRKIWHAKPETL